LGLLELVAVAAALVVLLASAPTCHMPSGRLITSCGSLLSI
jgi:hypothetical protein